MFNQLGVLSDYEIETLCTPLRQCLSVRTGPIDLSILTELEAHGYDQAPVYDSKRFLLGLVETGRLRILYQEGQHLSPSDPEVCDESHQFQIGGLVTLDHVLEKMTGRRAVFVIRASSATEYGYKEWNYGLLTLSDLNRQPFRAALYSVLAELESRFAILVDAEFEDPWDWAKTLGEEQHYPHPGDRCIYNGTVPPSGESYF